MICWYAKWHSCDKMCHAVLITEGTEGYGRLFQKLSSTRVHEATFGKRVPNPSESSVHDQNPSVSAFFKPTPEYQTPLFVYLLNRSAIALPNLVCDSTNSPLASHHFR